MLLIIFIFLNIACVAYLLRKFFEKKYSLRLQIQDFQEKSNMLTYQNQHELKNQEKFKQRTSRYESLRAIIEEVNQNLAIEQIANSLTAVCFSLIANNKGVCMLYLVDSQTALVLSLFKTKKEDRHLIIKAKQGDIFDAWVAKHLSPLLIEDTKKDFRFDREKLATPEARPIQSLISAPLVTDRKLLGILRLDNPAAGFYSQDDLRFLVTISDLGAVALENGRLFQKTQDLAIHDGLTQLFTKGYFLERLREEYKRNVRQATPLSLLMLDIDFFKKYNDKFGHTSGDIVLKNLCATIRESLKHFSPIISRFGGEEFCVILPRTDKKEAYAIADNLREKIENMKITLRQEENHITVSIGIASFPADSRDEDGLILKADKALYEAKQKGRNQVCCI